LDLALRSEQATDKKATETKLKEKEKAVLDLEGEPTQRLTTFTDLVKNNRIAAITDYAKQGPKEFYAEAYSLCLTDPEFMRNNYPLIFDFFKGPYRN
jgi:Mlc titration factor MtfA (ptsG expression regulator)